MGNYWSRLTLFERGLLIGKILIGIYFLIFIIKNWQETTVDFWFFKVTAPLTLVFLFCGILGAVITSMYYGRKIKSKNEKIKDLTEKLINRGEQMIASHYNNPPQNPL